MNEKYFHGKYRIASARLPGYNYSQDGLYFVTICTQNLKCYFGDVINEEMVFSPLGKIAHKCWNEIPKHFPFVTLDKSIVMPNHVHGIIVINKKFPKPVEAQNIAPLHRDIKINPNYKNKFAPQSQNLPSIIRGFKIGVKKWATMNKIPFKWQPRYHDHIIRNHSELERIREYIKNNPAQWTADRNIPTKTSKRR